MPHPLQNYDVLIVGAGPSGSCAGAALARQGKRVLIAEKSDMTAPRIGESLLPHGNRLFKEIGVWDKIEAAGFIRKYGAEFENADSSKHVHCDFSKGLIKGLDYTYQVERPRFDRLLLQHAIDSGCQIARGAGIKNIHLNASGASVETAEGDNYRARWIIDASGNRKLIGRTLKLPTEPNPYPKRIAVYNHFEGVQRKTGKEAGNIIITRQKNGWFWQIPVTETLTSVGHVCLASEYVAAKQSPENWFQEQLGQTTGLRQRMQQAIPTTEFNTTTDYSHMFTQFCGERFFMVGDAATFSDPVFSSGVYLGIESALMAARAIDRADADKRPLTHKEQQAYTKDFKKQTAVVRHLINTFYEDSGFAVFMNPTDKFNLFAAVNSIVAGHTHPPRAVRWRYALFRQVCRWNRNYRLVPKALT